MHRVRTFNFREMRSSRSVQRSRAKDDGNKEIKSVVRTKAFKMINGSRRIGNKGAHHKGDVNCYESRYSSFRLKPRAIQSEVKERKKSSRFLYVLLGIRLPLDNMQVKDYTYSEEIVFSL